MSNSITVRVVEARNLKAADVLSGTSDPYFIISLSSKNYGKVMNRNPNPPQKSTICKKTRNPRWDREYTL